MNLLFLCTGNSCRSQMAEGWARHFANTLDRNDLQVASAGLEAHGLNPRAVATMAEFGVDISSHHSDILNDAAMDWADIIVSVCSHADQNCPLVPPNKTKLHIPFDDPAQADGSEQEIMDCFRRVCREISLEIEKLVDKLLSDSGVKQASLDG